MWDKQRYNCITRKRHHLIIFLDITHFKFFCSLLFWPGYTKGRGYIPTTQPSRAEKLDILVSKHSRGTVKYLCILLLATSIEPTRRHASQPLPQCSWSCSRVPESDAATDYTNCLDSETLIIWYVEGNTYYSHNIYKFMSLTANRHMKAYQTWWISLKIVQELLSSK